MTGQNRRFFLFLTKNQKNKKQKKQKRKGIRRAFVSNFVNFHAICSTLLQGGDKFSG